MVCFSKVLVTESIIAHVTLDLIRSLYVFYGRDFSLYSKQMKK